MGVSNRRGHSRLRARNLVGHVTNQGQRRTWVVENISGGGAFLSTEEVLPIGALVEVDLLAPGMKRTLRLRSRVVVSVSPSNASMRRTSPGIGVQFEDLSADAARRLEELLEVFEVRPSGSPTVQAVRPAVPLSAIKQRRHRRVSARNVLGNVQSNGELFGLACPVENVSVAGLRLETAEPLAVGSSVEIELFRVEHSLRVIVSGQVVGSVRPESAGARGLRPGMSVCFSAMTEATLGDLRTLLVDLAPAAAAELQEASPAFEVLPEPLQGQLIAGEVTDAVVAARLSQFEHGPVDWDAEESSAQPSDVREELARLRREVDERLARIAELEACVRNPRA